MKLKNLIEQSAREWSAMSGTELRKAYQQVKHAMKDRAKTFVKHGEGSLAKVLPSSRGLTEEQMQTRLKTASAYLRNEQRSKYAGWHESAVNKLHQMQAAMPDMGFKTIEDVRKFGNFMDEMEDRYRNIQYDSMTAKKLYKEAQRLNVDPTKFMRNFEYWMDHVDDLAKQQPIRQREGSRALKPSDYARKIEGGRMRRKGSD